MAIVAVLIAMGAFFLVSYQTSVQLQSSYTYAVSSVRTMQNKANNSSSLVSGSTRIFPDIYVLRISNNQILPYYCVLTSGGTLVNCYPYPNTGIEEFESIYGVNATSSCTSIGFTRLGVDVLTLSESAFSGNGTINTSGTCTITLTHKTSGDSREITLDLNLNKVEL